MPSTMVQGQSEDVTEIKQRGLSYAFRIGLTLMVKKFPQYRYFHFDLHAGSGYNDKYDCNGSPLTFLNEAALAKCSNYLAGFCDRDGEQVRRLLARPELDHQRCYVFHGDNAELLYMVPDIVRNYKENLKFATGSILSDPNGADVPINAIIDLAKICPRLDVIFHWNANITKRLRYGIKQDQIMLDDVVRIVQKDHWLIRKPAGRHQFTMLIGRNMPTRDWPSMGFYNLDSPKGQQILKLCSLSARDFAALEPPQPELFP